MLFMLMLFLAPRVIQSRYMIPKVVEIKVLMRYYSIPCHFKVLRYQGVTYFITSLIWRALSLNCIVIMILELR